MRKQMMGIMWLIVVVVVAGVVGCSDLSGPASGNNATGVTTTASVISQDLAQLSVAGVTNEWTTGVFSIGWKKFVGPDIMADGTVGEAYAVVQTDTSASIRPGGIDIGTVSLSYTGGSAELTKRTTRDSLVLYETFSRGMHLSSGTAVNIPFVANGVYSFTVSGSTAFPAGTFTITAPASLLALTGHANGDTISVSSDLRIQWTGGMVSDSVLIRIVPHLRPLQLAGRNPDGVPDSLRGGGHGPKCHRDGKFAVGGPMAGLGPEFDKGLILTVPNTGSYTLTSSDLQTLISGTTAAELMVGVTQVVKTQVTHNGGAVNVLLRNGDRLVLRTK
jgi:hypothetical protein